MRIPFNRPYVPAETFDNVRAGIDAGYLGGEGQNLTACEQWLEELTGAPRVMMTHSCTGALEMAAILAELEPGDEVIMPSFTFVTTATAFTLRGAIPVFVDIDPATLTMDPAEVEGAVSGRTKAIVPVHYAGVGCDMGPIMSIAQRADAMVVEDAAHGILARRDGLPLGRRGKLATLSFHETKNLISGQGGALLINDEGLIARAQHVRDKGTNRREFFENVVSRYEWVDEGSSFGMSELTAAFLWVQFEQAQKIQAQRTELWSNYHRAFQGLEQAGHVRRPVIPSDVEHNAHLYYLMLPSKKSRDDLIQHLAQHDVNAVFHYIPLHTSPAGQRLGRAVGDLPNTRAASDRLIRLPMWIGLEPHQSRVISAVCDFF